MLAPPFFKFPLQPTFPLCSKTLRFSTNKTQIMLKGLWERRRKHLAYDVDMKNKSYTDFLLFTDYSFETKSKTEIMLLWSQAVLTQKRGHKSNKRSKTVRKQLNGIPAESVVIL